MRPAAGRISAGRQACAPRHAPLRSKTAPTRPVLAASHRGALRRRARLPAGGRPAYGSTGRPPSGRTTPPCDAFGPCGLGAAAHCPSSPSGLGTPPVPLRLRPTGGPLTSPHSFVRLLSAPGTHLVLRPTTQALTRLRPTERAAPHPAAATPSAPVPPYHSTRRTSRPQRPSHPPRPASVHTRTHPDAGPHQPTTDPASHIHPAAPTHPNPLTQPQPHPCPEPTHPLQPPPRASPTQTPAPHLSQPTHSLSPPTSQPRRSNPHPGPPPRGPCHPGRDTAFRPTAGRRARQARQSTRHP